VELVSVLILEVNDVVGLEVLTVVVNVDVVGLVEVGVTVVVGL
jgi:hypothetical protein